MKTKSQWSAKESRKQEKQNPELLNVPGARLKIQTVQQITGFSASTIRRAVATGDFPDPIKYGSRCTRWDADDVKKWLSENKPRTKERKSTAKNENQDEMMSLLTVHLDHFKREKLKLERAAKFLSPKFCLDVSDEVKELERLIKLTTEFIKKAGLA